MAQNFLVPRKRSAPTEKQNIKVVVRVRPLNEKEVEVNASDVCKYLSNTEFLVRDKKFVVDYIYKEVSQVEMYQRVVAPMIPDVLNGYNCSVFAYGQTGSGKTFTMTGAKFDNLENWKQDEDAGIILRAASQIFNEVSDKHDISVKISYLELYNEEIRDLFSEEDIPLSIYNDFKGAVCVQGLTCITVQNTLALFKQLERGNLKRQTAPTLMNHQSSRSHTVFTLMVVTQESTSSHEHILKTGKINFVDLAGSENINRAGCKDMRAVELANINKSLLTLGRVITCLSEKRVKHVPYRDSKLTRILQDSLGGHTKTCIITTITPASIYADVTISTLEYATRARDIKNCPTVNERVNQQQVIENLLCTVRRLEVDLEACRQGVGFYVSKEHYDSIIQEVKVLREEKEKHKEVVKDKDKRILELENQITFTKKENEETMLVFQQSKDALHKLEHDVHQKKVVLDQERFLSHTYEKEANQLRDDFQDLIKTLEKYSEESGILHEKLERQFFINKTNEIKARETVATLVQKLEELTEQRNDTQNVNYSICKICKEEIQEFRAAVQNPVLEMKQYLEKFDRDFAKDIPIKENVCGLLKEFLSITNKHVSEIKDMYDGYVTCKGQFDSIYIADFPSNVQQIDEKFQKATFAVVKKLLALYRKKEQELYDRIQEDVLLRRQQDEALLKNLRSLKEETYSDDVNTLMTELNQASAQSKSENVAYIEQFLNGYKEMSENLPPGNVLDKVIDNAETFGEDLKRESEKLEEQAVTVRNAVLDSLSRTVTSQFEGFAKTVDSNLESLMCKFGYMLEGREQEDRFFNNFVSRSKDLLMDHFLGSLVTTIHEGDTPTRKSGVNVRSVDSLAPREVLIKRFKELNGSAPEEEN